MCCIRCVGGTVEICQLLSGHEPSILCDPWWNLVESEIAAVYRKLWCSTPKVSINVTS